MNRTAAFKARAITNPLPIYTIISRKRKMIGHCVDMHYPIAIAAFPDAAARVVV